MADVATISERLLKRFKGVPNYDISDATLAVEDAMLSMGYAVTDSVPDDKVTALLLYAQSESAFNIAMSVAHYFQYTDGEESVNKSMISDKYKALAKDLRDRFDEELEKEKLRNGSSFSIATRVDRDSKRETCFWLGNSLARPWWR